MAVRLFEAAIVAGGGEDDSCPIPRDGVTRALPQPIHSASVRTKTIRVDPYRITLLVLHRGKRVSVSRVDVPLGLTRWPNLG